MLKMITKLKYLAIGMILGSLLIGGVVFAESDQFSLALFKVKLVFNGEEKQGGSTPYMFNNGKAEVPTSLLYSGTTYIPLAFFANALNQPVKYDEKTKTIYVGKIPDGNKAVVIMSDSIKPYYTDKGFDTDVNRKMTIGGNAYSKGFQFAPLYPGVAYTTSFNLDAKYKTISGIAGLEDTYNKNDATINVFGDEKLLMSITLKAGGLPQKFNLDVTGIKKLDMKVNASDYNALVDLADVTIE